jgi:hypothetical protein
VLADNQGYQHWKIQLTMCASILMAMDQPKTRLVTLYRLSDISASYEGMWVHDSFVGDDLAQAWCLGV